MPETTRFYSETATRQETYPRQDAQRRFYSRLTARLEALPGVDAVAIASVGPTGNARSIPYERSESVAAADEALRPAVAMSIISPRYFPTLGMNVLAGRDFTDFDSESSVPVALVNQLFATANWPDGAPVGRRIRLFEGTAPGPWLTVVGVVPDVAAKDRTRQEFAPAVYVPYGQHPRSDMWVWMRTRVPNENLVSAFRGQVQAIDPNLATVLGPRPLNEFLAESYQYRATTGVLFLSCGLFALILASIGLYVVVAQTVSQRTREIGVRMVIGATRRDIAALVIQRGMMPVGIGLALGVAAATAVNRMFAAQLIRVSPFDPLTVLAATGVESMHLSGVPPGHPVLTGGAVSSAAAWPQKEHRCAGQSRWWQNSSQDRGSSTKSWPSTAMTGSPRPRWG